MNTASGLALAWFPGSHIVLAISYDGTALNLHHQANDRANNRPSTLERWADVSTRQRLENRLFFLGYYL
jgi:hypothetical protein